MTSEQKHTADTARLLHERRICAIIPTYNNAGTIADVVRRTLLQCHDVIVVNDGSTDGTRELLLQTEGITLVDYPKNAGKGTALKRGLRKAIEMGFSYAITLDADGQHFPEDIPLFLEANLHHPEAIILGQRKLDGVERSGGSKFANAFGNFWFCVQTLHYVPDTQTGFRLYPLHKLHGLSLLTSRYEAELELLVSSAWNGVRIVSVPVNVYYPPRQERVSHFRPGPDFTRIFILNTFLCLLAFVWGYPLYLLRFIDTVFRTAFALTVYLVGLCIIIPLSLIYVPIAKMFHLGSSPLRTLLYFTGKVVSKLLYVASGKVSIVNTTAETFSKPAIIICNHQSHLDLMVLLGLTRKMIFLTNDWVYNSPFFGYILRHAEYYPVSMGYDQLKPRIKDLTDRGYSIAIFPEGTRSEDCQIGRFHKGAFQLATDLGIDILPLMLYGACKALPKNSKYMHRSPIVLHVGERVNPQQLSQLGDTVQERAKWFRRLYAQWLEENQFKIQISKFKGARGKEQGTRGKEQGARGKRIVIAILFAAIATASFARINIWEGTSCHKKVWMTPYLAKGGTDIAVIVCPGGSYFWHDMDAEGRSVAEWLQANGISAFLLKYRTAQTPAFVLRYRYLFRGVRYPDAQDDLKQALAVVRSHAAELGIDPEKVGAMGFSAGGHLVMSGAELFTTQERPSFVVPIYPVVTMVEDCVHKRSRRALLGDSRKNNQQLRERLSLERNVPANCPPVFLVNCQDDPIVQYRNAELLDAALSEQNVPHLYLQYLTGGHGFGASPTKGTPECRQWKDAFMDWIKTLYKNG